jgi:hypothetical protein
MVVTSAGNRTAPAGCPPEISSFPSTTTAGTPLIPRAAPLPLDGEGGGGWGEGTLRPGVAREASVPCGGPRRAACLHPLPTLPRRGGGLCVGHLSQCLFKDGGRLIAP